MNCMNRYGDSSYSGAGSTPIAVPAGNWVSNGPEAASRGRAGRHARSGSSRCREKCPAVHGRNNLRDELGSQASRQGGQGNRAKEIEAIETTDHNTEQRSQRRKRIL